MAVDSQNESEPSKKSSSLMKLIVWIIVLAVSIGGGFATPLLIAQFSGAWHLEPESESSLEASPDPMEKVAFIDFDEVVVNLDESRFNRYLKMSFSLQVGESQKAHVQELLEANQAVLKNWLISHVADKSTEDIRGKIGHYRLRREIQERFNAVLFEDGIERIQDVLFREMITQ